MDLEERAKLNLTVLKRHDPSICDICDQSPHAVVYKFIRDKNGWVNLVVTLFDLDRLIYSFL